MKICFQNSRNTKEVFSFVKVGQNTSRINVQRFPNPQKSKMSQEEKEGGGKEGNEEHFGLPCGRQKIQHARDLVITRSVDFLRSLNQHRSLNAVQNFEIAYPIHFIKWTSWAVGI